MDAENDAAMIAEMFDETAATVTAVIRAIASHHGRHGEKPPPPLDQTPNGATRVTDAGLRTARSSTTGAHVM